MSVSSMTRNIREIMAKVIFFPQLVALALMMTGILRIYCGVYDVYDWKRLFVLRWYAWLCLSN